MGDKTGISWTDATWNPIRGCSRVSPGCTNCYAEVVANRFKGPGQPYEGLVSIGRKGPRWNGRVRLIEDHLLDPLRWKKPRRIFVNSMSDLFHEALPVSTIASVFAVMSFADRHTFQVLTKRAERARELLNDVAFVQEVAAAREQRLRFPSPARSIALRPRPLGLPWPLPNVHLGVSVEDQPRAEERIRHLFMATADVRFLSIEPQLGPISLAPFLPPRGPCATGRPDQAMIDWVIVGGESGRRARPFDLQWAHELRRECAAAEVPFFFKQAGSNAHDSMRSMVCGWEPDDPEPDTRVRFKDQAGADPAEWPPTLQVQQFPTTIAGASPP